MAVNVLLHQKSTFVAKCWLVDLEGSFIDQDFWLLVIC